MNKRRRKKALKKRNRVSQNLNEAFKAVYDQSLGRLIQRASFWEESFNKRLSFTKTI